MVIPRKSVGVGGGAILHINAQMKMRSYSEGNALNSEGILWGVGMQKLHSFYSTSLKVALNSLLHLSLATN